MKYISTRGYRGKTGKGATFAEVTLDGLAPDGGLYVPESTPHFDALALDTFSSLSYQEIAFEIMHPFVGADVPEAKLKELIQKAYGTFDTSDVTPLVPLAPHHHVLELYHGPTLAFKDVALQFLGLLLDFLLEKQHRKLTVLGATSGDTGPAAIEGLKGRKHVQIFMLYPHGRVSDFQRKQMTTVNAKNVHAIAIDGTFDDCQHLVKTLFNDAEFRQKQALTAINSISWARLLPQMVYYFYAYSRLRKPLTFVVPTGNFGDIFAGYMAQKCGLPVEKLVIANNQNDILTRFVNQNDYSVAGVYPTQSPSIDISVASNFERYLFDLLGQDPEQLKHFMHTFDTTKALPKLPETLHQKVRRTFAAYSVNEAQTTQTIATYWQHTQRLFDPHTAVGLYAAGQCLAENAQSHVVTLSTAHPAKFAESVRNATGQTPKVPEALQPMTQKPEQCTRLKNDAAALKALIEAI